MNIQEKTMNKDNAIRNLVFKGLTISIVIFVGLAVAPLPGQSIQMTPEFQRSRQLLAQGDYEGAANSLQTLLTHSSLAAAAQVELGTIRLRQAEIEMSRALTNFQTAAQFLSVGIESGGVTGPELPKTLYDLGRIYEERLHQYPQAAAIYETIVREHPNFLAIDKVMFNWAACLEKTGHLAEAAEAYRTIVAEHPYSSHFQFAQARMQQLAGVSGQVQATIDVQESVLYDFEDEDQISKATMNLASMYETSGDFSKAADTYRKLTDSSDPEIAQQAFRNLANLLDSRKRDYSGAVAVLEEYIEKHPDADNIEQSMFQAGRIYEENISGFKLSTTDGEQRRYRKSTEHLRKAIDHYDNLTDRFPDADVSADALLRKGEIYSSSLHDYDSARREYRDFLDRFPNHREANNVRQRLREIENR